MTAMPRDLSGYRIMWCIALFDLPVVTAEERKRANRFRKILLGAGFTRLQLSVYAQPFPDERRSERAVRIIKSELPPDGEVRLMFLTDKQFARMQVFLGKKAKAVEKASEQLWLL